MRFFEKIFGNKGQAIESYADFWSWFQLHEKDFFHIVKNERNIEKNFFNKLSPKLNELKEGYYFVTGMSDENTVELILTADGEIGHIVFVEELIAAAPEMKGWKFTALKPPLSIEDVNIEMSPYQFNAENISFYSSDLPAYPDEIDITIVNNDLNTENESDIRLGTFIFLDNFLGELDFATQIDNLNILGPKDAEKELVPIAKLKDFLIWRQKEFVEKYKGLRHDTEHDSYSAFEAKSKDGYPILLMINSQLLDWDSKASHPWISIFTIRYKTESESGFPNQEDYALLNTIEDEIMKELTDFDGYLNVGRQTVNGKRDIFFACKDFRKPSKTFFHMQKRYADRFEIKYEMFKDKYWRFFERFRVN